MHINPDHFLQTPEGRVITPERNAWAWEQCFAALPEALKAVGPGGRIYVLVGPQGSGKSTWARATRARETDAAIFDAILVKRTERAPILAEARRQGVAAIAVWFRTPLDACLERNRSRPPDEVVSERGLRNVFAALEPPSEEEGFAGVIAVDEPTTVRGSDR
jgi:predicted kinase